jgi:ABC-2 type transport system permease protein
MINRFFLWLVLSPSFLYKKMGVNTVQLTSILRTKLIMDDRRPASIQHAQKSKKGAPTKGATLVTMFVTALLGCFFIFSFFITQHRITQLTIFFTLFIFLLASTLISDFTSVLIDIRDNYIILPKPINDKTFLLSRLLHIIIHSAKIIIPLALPSAITIGIKYGFIHSISFFFLIIPASLFTIFIINAIYVFILKITTPEKFKNLISYFQIIFSIVIYAGYQIVPRFMNKALFNGFEIPAIPSSLLIPSYWFAGAWELIYTGRFNFYAITCFFASLFIPALAIWVVIKYFAPSFNRKLAMISGSEQQEQVVVASEKGKTSSNKAFSEKLANWLTKSGSERMGFLQTWKITSRSREFKMRVYPAMGYILVYLVLIFLRVDKNKLADLSLNNNSGVFVCISAIYFISFVILQVIAQLPYSDKYKAAWIYFISPIESPGPIFSGSVKAAILKFYLPLALIVSVIGTVVFGIEVIPNLLLGISNQLLLCFVIGYISYRTLPFSQLENTSKKAGSFIRGLISFLIPFITATTHYFIFRFSIVVWLLFALSLLANWLIAGSIYNKKWSDINMGYIDN